MLPRVPDLFSMTSWHMSMKAIWCPDSSLVSGAHSASRILSSESLPWQLGTRGATLRHASVDWWFYTRGMVADSLVCRLSVSHLFVHENNQGNDITSRFPVEKLVCKPTTCIFQETQVYEPWSHRLESPKLESAQTALRMRQWCP